MILLTATIVLLILPKAWHFRAGGFQFPVPAVRVFLIALQTMQFCLCTGFGESEALFGGTKEHPLAGSGQGSGAAPAAFNVISALVVNAYRCMGHGARLTSSYTVHLFCLLPCCCHVRRRH